MSAVCRGVLRYVAVCCDMSRCVAMCRGMSRCVAVRRGVSRCVAATSVRPVSTEPGSGATHNLLSVVEVFGEYLNLSARF